MNAKTVKLVHLNPVGGDLYVIRPFQAATGGQLPSDGSDGSAIPDNELPDHPAPTPPAGMVIVLVRSADGKWRWAALPSEGVPTPLPEPTPAPK